MQALILAAGMGRRLGEYTSKNTKCMLKVNETRLIDRMLTQLFKLRLSRIIIVTGYESKNLQDHIRNNYPDTSIEFINNPIYDKTNNIYSLWLAKEYLLKEDTLLLESDLIFEDKVLDSIIKSPYKDCALVSKYQTWMDGTMVRIDEENNIVNFIPKKAFKYSDTQFYYKTVNIYKFSKEFLTNHYLPFLDAYIKVLGENEYYEQVLRVITLIDNSNIKALPLSGQKWYEIDDIQDLKIAETIFATGYSKLEKIQKSYGGYWRYPFLLDFCYLVNPYFPKRRMIDEMKANFETLLRNYPSGMQINALLAAKYFKINQEYICVGNGAAELIKSITEKISGKIGVIYPTFEEYPNRKEKEDLVIFNTSQLNFKYDYKEIIDFFNDKDIKNLVLINPDNPSGNYIEQNSLKILLDWCKKREIQLILDESFVDFTDNFENNSLLKDSILENFPNLVVIKSISKSYGVPGLRLGILASANKELIKETQKDVSIWNINSFAEFYMQIYGKYENDYKSSCFKFIKERKRFYALLKTIPYLSVYNSHANYFLCKIKSGFSSFELTEKLLDQHDILIKDCSGKKGFDDNSQYIRIAIRDEKDNNKLYEVLKSIN